MKRIVFVLFLLPSFSSFAQENAVDTIDRVDHEVLANLGGKKEFSFSRHEGDVVYTISKKDLLAAKHLVAKLKGMPSETEIVSFQLSAAYMNGRKPILNKGGKFSRETSYFITNTKAGTPVYISHIKAKMQDGTTTYLHAIVVHLAPE